jgi:serine/threonine protein kinase
VDRYHILQVIGKGSFAVTVQAVDTFHPDCCLVAIKIMDVHNSSLGIQEANYMRLLNCADSHDCVHIVRLLVLDLIVIYLNVGCSKLLMVQLECIHL